MILYSYPIGELRNFTSIWKIFKFNLLENELVRMNKFYSILWINLSRRINLRHVLWLILHVSFCSPPYIHDKRGEFSRKLPILGLTFYPTRVSASSPGSWLKSRRNDFIPFACTALYVALPKRRTFPLSFLFSFCSTA